MTRARNAAERCMRSYFRSLGESWPEDDANEYVMRLLPQRFEKTGLNERQRAVIDDITRRARFDVDDLIENHMGITVWIDDLSELDAEAGARVYGYAKPEANVIAICERVAYEPLRRATLMHEAGHILLHGSHCERALSYSPAAKKRPPEEREADEFMVNTLLPRMTLVLAVIRAADRSQMRIEEAFMYANTKRGRWQWRTRHFRFLVNRLCVSRHMLSLAMFRMGCFNGATHQYHLGYRLETAWSVKPDMPLRGNLGPYVRSILTDITSH